MKKKEKQNMTNEECLKIKEETNKPKPFELFKIVCFSQDSQAKNIWWSYGIWCIAVNLTTQK